MTAASGHRRIPRCERRLTGPSGGDQRSGTIAADSGDIGMRREARRRSETPHQCAAADTETGAQRREGHGRSLRVIEEILGAMDNIVEMIPMFQED